MVDYLFERCVIFAVIFFFIFNQYVCTLKEKALSLAFCANWRRRRKRDYLVLLYQDGGSHRKRLQVNTGTGEYY